MAKADLGLKRTCLSCGMRFYDFNRTPIICPGCQTEFDPEAVIRSRRGRATTKDSPKAGKQAEMPVMDDAVDMDEDKDDADSEVGGDEAGGGMEFGEADINVNEDDSAGLIGDDLDKDEDIIPGISNEDE